MEENEEYTEVSDDEIEVVDVESIISPSFSFTRIWEVEE